MREKPSLEKPHDAIRGTRYIEGGEYPCHRRADLVARIHGRPPVSIVHIAYGQAESKVPASGCRPLRFQEAPGKDVKLGLGHGSFQAQE